ncbi:MAG: hypothetical protein ACUVWP_08585 [bacterium]
MLKRIIHTSLLGLFLLPLFAFTVGEADLVEITGNISSKNEENSFTVHCNMKTVEIAFEYPEEAEFWVMVNGEYGDKLGDFNLKDGKYITLTGGGTFTLTVYAKKGKGDWSAWITGGENE